MKTGVLVSDFAQQPRHENADVPDIYLTSLAAAGKSSILVLNKSFKAAEREEAGSLSMNERQKLQRVHTWGGDAYGSARKILKASNQPIPEERHFLDSRPSDKKFKRAKHKFERMRAIFCFENEFWCMHLAYIDKLATDNTGVKCLLIHQDLLDRTVEDKKVKRKDSKETVRAFLAMITKKIRPQRVWVDKGTEFDGESQNLCKDEQIQIYSTMNDTKAAIAERTKQPLKKLLSRYMEDYKNKYIQKLFQFVKAVISPKKLLDKLDTKNVKNSGFLSNLYSKPLRRNRQPKYKIGDIFCIWKYDSPFRKG